MKDTKFFVKTEIMKFCLKLFCNFFMNEQEMQYNHLKWIHSMNLLRNSQANKNIDSISVHLSARIQFNSQRHASSRRLYTCASHDTMQPND